MAKVLIVGASDSPERYSYKALHMLRSKGHEVFLYSPKHQEIEGLKVYQNFTEIPKPIDVITLYVNPTIGAQMAKELAALKAKLTIFNPGTESSTLANHLETHGTKTLEACTLVLLTTDQFNGVIDQS